MKAVLEKIDSLKTELDKLRPLTSAQVKNLKKLFDIDLTYNSNAIEGSTLSYNETKIILEDGITIGGKSVKEHLEAINHKEAIDYIETLAIKKTEELTQYEVLSIHNIILRSIDTDNAGKYRNVPVFIRQKDKIHRFAEPFIVPKLMEDFFSWLKTPTQDHPVIFASDAHYKLVSIHPFIDGNGRTSRLLMNLILIQNGYPPAVIKMKERARYINAIEKAQTREDLSDFYAVVAGSVKESLELYLEILNSGAIIK
ncbi:MAG: Fic family protein [bacterium]|nr:Fic family protein [bacterium]